MTLEEFLAMDEEEDYLTVEIPRIHLTFKLKSLSAKMSNQIQMDVVRELRRKNPNITMGDPLVIATTLDRLLLASIVEPDLLDPRLLAKAKVQYPEEILGKILRPGEYDQIVFAYRKLSGDNNLSPEMIQQAKN